MSEIKEEEGFLNEEATSEKPKVKKKPTKAASKTEKKEEKAEEKKPEKEVEEIESLTKTDVPEKVDFYLTKGLEIKVGDSITSCDRLFVDHDKKVCARFVVRKIDGKRLSLNDLVGLDKIYEFIYSHFGKAIEARAVKYINSRRS